LGFKKTRPKNPQTHLNTPATLMNLNLPRAIKPTPEADPGFPPCVVSDTIIVSIPGQRPAGNASLRL
jgi:hypothetical protein